jgi:hypothetical protein
MQGIKGDSAKNLDKAIQHCQQALEVHTRQDYPEKWAMHQILFATIILERKHGEPSEYTEQAIRHFQQAREVFTQNEYPEEWARVQGGLAIAYRERYHDEESPKLTYPQLYKQESNYFPGKKRTLKLKGSIIPDFPYVTHLLLIYEWEDDLPEEEAQNLTNRAIVYVACAIYDVAIEAGLFCQPSPIPNGRRPAWILEREKSPVSLILSDIDLEEKNCHMTIGTMVTRVGGSPSNRAHWEKLHAGFKALLSEICV